MTNEEWASKIIPVLCDGRKGPEEWGQEPVS